MFKLGGAGEGGAGGGGAGGGHLISTFLSQSFLSVTDRGEGKDTWNAFCREKKCQTFSVGAVAASSEALSHPEVAEVTGLAVGSPSCRFSDQFFLQAVRIVVVFFFCGEAKVFVPNFAPVIINSNSLSSNALALELSCDSNEVGKMVSHWKKKKKPQS